jgi:hypothetical protein
MGMEMGVATEVTRNPTQFQADDEPSNAYLQLKKGAKHEQDIG